MLSGHNKKKSGPGNGGRNKSAGMSNIFPEDIREGDKAAFKSLFVNFYEPLCHFVHGFTRRMDISEELVQDVFANIWEKRTNWKPDNISAWLYRAARNRALDFLKHEKVVEKYRSDIEGMYEEVETPDISLDNLSIEEAARKAIEELPERCRTTFVLHRQGGLTYAEIAETMGVSVKTVESQMSRALTFLRSRLQHFLSLWLLLALSSILKSI